MRLTQRFKAASHAGDEDGGAALLQPDALLQRKLIARQSVSLRSISARCASRFVNLPADFHPRARDPLLRYPRRGVLFVYNDCVAWGGEDEEGKDAKPLRRVVAYKDLRLARAYQVRPFTLHPPPTSSFSPVCCCDARAVLSLRACGDTADCAEK